MLVVDEIDELFSLVFTDQIHYLFKNHLPQETQICTFSATEPRELLEFINKFMRDPVRIVIERDYKSLEGVRQFYINTEKEEWKLETLLDLFIEIPFSQCIIYCNSCTKVSYLAEQIENRDQMYSVSHMHNQMTQTTIESAIYNFRCGNSRILITNDLNI